MKNAALSYGNVLKRDVFCVFEGIDGSGKTTLIERVKNEILLDHPDFTDSILLLREPTSGSTGQKIRSLLMAGAHLERSEWIDLFMKDREENVNLHILPALQKKQLILQDRYFYSTAAYQGKETEAPTVYDIVNVSLSRKFPEPDLLFFLDIPPDAALERIQNTRKNLESFETLNQLEVFYKNFLKILPENCIFLDAMEDQDEIVDETVRIIYEYMESME